MKFRKIKMAVLASAVSLLVLSGTPSVFAAPGDLIGFGDSNTDGSNFDELYPTRLNERWVVRVGAINKGNSGDDIIEGYNRYRNDVLLADPDTVTIMFGMNDMVLDTAGNPKISKLVYEDHLNKMIDWAKSYGIRPILMTEPPVVEGPFYARYSSSMKSLYVAKGGVRAWANSYNGLTRKVANARGVTLIDNYDNFVIKAGGATDTNLNNSGLIDSTGNHMTPYGHDTVTYSVNYYK